MSGFSDKNSNVLNLDGSNGGPNNLLAQYPEIPDNVKNNLEIIPVRWIDRVLELALERLPLPLRFAALLGLL